MKGIILAAGKGTRLYPMTKVLCKPLLPIYDKPMIYYPLTTLLQAGIRDILVIIPPDTEDSFSALLGDGHQLGIHIEYKVQHEARGIADAFIIGEEFINGQDVCLALGDNIFWHENIRRRLKAAKEAAGGATVFGYWVEDPRPFGVVEFDEKGRAISIEEKPSKPKSNYIIPGLYFYDNKVVEMAKTLELSARGELEITDINLKYMELGELQVVTLPQDCFWMDTGTSDTLLDAANQVKALKQKGHLLGYIEMEAYEQGLIDAGQLTYLQDQLESTEYGKTIAASLKYTNENNL
ncbi:glucose-1-phosphate thymidylyltransferase RfbA [Hominibacterium faecale]|uniref:glucose-1-phosphate thymidylyltransferase RfbA n=1 Tax=Hominibacterium faecale TaxID=2839743 RepID=UPI0022B2A854|nr:glucose-1-phosphate thymidylyltransferase RfbA [Hominibacterium faecale]